MSENTQPTGTTDSTEATDATGTAVARLAMITLDAAETEPLARFWHGVLGWPLVHCDEDYAMLTGPTAALGIGRIPDYREPAWPDHGTKQFHLDLAVEDLEAAADRCEELGARRPEDQPGETWIVLLDPAGHPFCLTDAKNWG